MFTLLLTLLPSARAQCMTWRVNFVRSKDAQKQLTRTSLIRNHDGQADLILIDFRNSDTLHLSAILCQFQHLRQAQWWQSKKRKGDQRNPARHLSTFAIVSTDRDQIESLEQANTALRSEVVFLSNVINIGLWQPYLSNTVYTLSKCLLSEIRRKRHVSGRTLSRNQAGFAWANRVTVWKLYLLLYFFLSYFMWLAL